METSMMTVERSLNWPFYGFRSILIPHSSRHESEIHIWNIHNSHTSYLTSVKLTTVKPEFQNIQSNRIFIVKPAFGGLPNLPSVLRYGAPPLIHLYSATVFEMEFWSHRIFKDHKSWWSWENRNKILLVRLY